MVRVVSANEWAGFAMQIRVAAHAPKPGRAEKKGTTSQFWVVAPWDDTALHDPVPHAFSELSLQLG